MTITIQPAPARTDDPTVRAGRTFVRRAGLGVAAGSAVWAAGLLAYGANPTGTVGEQVANLSSLAFQLGLFGLITVQLKTRATGTSRVARAMLKVEYGLLAVATLWTILWSALPDARESVPLLVMDLFWPLSMLGMFVIAIKIATAGRWTGLLRGWPLIAESWAVVNVPIAGALGDSVLRWTASGHLIVGYLALGVILMLRPELTGARD
ncbi:hypothetical protein KOI35_23415 [Actinoplanes bogorensis]|uniref:Uncharacterized protein n=1 Tax=Paractinoplanes bogorensis TaxID=1610840 RepID=A0ABS5YSM5_9ACTN|nr:hypothetical protein [Actinoplanes bogorensis]MBU2666459.1 hypothetical protein [Actinoplanes bogorensis]